VRFLVWLYLVLDGNRINCERVTPDLLALVVEAQPAICIATILMATTIDFLNAWNMFNPLKDLTI